MQITTTNLAPATSIDQSSSREKLLQNLRPGQILRATALGADGNGNTKLQIGATQVTAQGQLSLRPGQPLLLRVEKTGPLPELQLLTSVSPKQLQAEALRVVLPRQQPLSALFERLLASNAPSPEKSLPPPVRQAIQEVLGRLPSAQDPDFKQQFKDALMQSGLFSEASLARGVFSANDVKLNLLALAALIRPLVSEQAALKGQAARSKEPSHAPLAERPGLELLVDLDRQLDGALARIQLNQLSSLPREGAAPQMWQFELPMRHADQVDVLQIALKREGSSSSGDEASSWSLSLQMSLADLGPMQIQLKLQGNEISTLVRSERSATTELVTKNLPTLQAALASAGLEVKRITAFTAKVEEESGIPSDVSLLDELA